MKILFEVPEHKYYIVALKGRRIVSYLSQALNFSNKNPDYKFCATCLKKLPRDSFSPTGKHYHNSSCTPCKYSKSLHKTNPELARKLQKKYKKKNADKIREQQKIQSLNYRENLHDSYVKALIRAQVRKQIGGTLENIPKSLIESKRAELQTRRVLKEYKDGNACK